jgi:hypothetical protein
MPKVVCHEGVNGVKRRTPSSSHATLTAHHRRLFAQLEGGSVERTGVGLGARGRLETHLGRRQLVAVVEASRAIKVAPRSACVHFVMHVACRRWGLASVGLVCGLRPARYGDHILHLTLAAQVEFDGVLQQQGPVQVHGLARIVVRGEGNEGIAMLAPHDVHASVWDGQAVEEAADIEGTGRPGQVLKPDYDGHLKTARRPEASIQQTAKSALVFPMQISSLNHPRQNDTGIMLE